MDSLADQYEQNAKVALVLARASADTAVRKDWLNIAGAWVGLAKARRHLIGVSCEPTLPGRFKRRVGEGGFRVDTE